MILALTDQMATTLLAAAVSLVITVLGRIHQTTTWQREDKRRVFAEFHQLLKSVVGADDELIAMGLPSPLERKKRLRATEYEPRRSLRRRLLLGSSDTYRMASESSADATANAAIDVYRDQVRRLRAAEYQMAIIGRARTYEAGQHMRRAYFSRDADREVAAELRFLMEVRRELGYLRGRPDLYLMLLLARRRFRYQESD